jgi:lipopolysaccharide transport system ATP-binding protein
MSSDTVISVSNLSKAYRLGTIGSSTLKDDLNRFWSRMRGQADPMNITGSEHHLRKEGGAFWALQDVSFELKQSEVLGIIGRNGAGKSTLLKILSRITAPTHGEVRLKGRVTSLLEIGTGFHPDLTGRENIFLNGAIMGMSRREIQGKSDEIIDFSGVEDFIDTPVKRYSSGMYVRLGFAVASSLEPDIFIADEVLAVGDATFRAKCYRKLAGLRQCGTAILLVSHSMPDIQRVCSRCLWLSEGSIAQSGETPKVVSQYLLHCDAQSNRMENNNCDSPKKTLPGAKIVRVRTIDKDGHDSSSFKTGEELRIRVEYEITAMIDGLNFSVSISSKEDALYNGYASLHDGFTVYSAPGQGHVDLVFPKLCLGAGTYWLTAGLSDKDYFGVYDWQWQVAKLSVVSDIRLLGRFAFLHYWQSSECDPNQRFSSLF